MSTNGSAAASRLGIVPITAPLEEAPAPEARFRFLDDVEIQNLPPLAWLVEDIIPERGFAVIYGQPETAKSFAALSLAFSIATGHPFFGRDVHQGPVVYVAAEGSAGLGQRVEAWKQSAEHYGRAGVLFLTEAVDMGDITSVSAFAHVVGQLPEAPRLIVFDTLARSLVGGDENSSQDVGLLIHHASQLQKLLNTAVLFIHHTRKDGEAERGSSALRGAADVMMRCDREKGSQTITLVCDKAKDAPHFSNIVLELVQVADSCTLITPRNAFGVSVCLPGSQPHRILESLQRASLDDGLTASEWKTVCGFPDSTFYMHRKTLVTLGYVAKAGVKRGARYVVTPEGEELITTNSNLTPMVTP